MAQTRDYLIRFREKGLDELNRKTSRLDGAFASLGSRLAVAATAAGTFVAAFASVNAIQVAGEFEALRVRLENMYGSLERGNRAFETFQQLAATTPFSVKQVVEAGATLKAFGLDAESTIKTVADLAAFMGRDLVESASAVGRAFAGGIGASEILREGGIINRVLTRTGKTVQDFSKDLPGFRKALFETFQDPTQGIAGATDKLSKTFQGAVSNAGDAVQRLGGTIGEKLLPEATAATKQFTEMVNSFRLLVKAAPDLGEVFTFIGATFEALGNKWDSFAANIPAPLKTFGALLVDLQKNINPVVKYVDDLAGVYGGLWAEIQRIINEQRLKEQADEQALAFERQREATAMATQELNAYRKMTAVTTLQNIQYLQDLEDKHLEVMANLPKLDPIELMPPSQWEQWAEAGTEAANRVEGALQSAFLDTFRNGENAMESFLNAFKSMLEQMLAELLAKAIMFFILQAIGVPVGGGGGGGGFLNFAFSGSPMGSLQAPSAGGGPVQNAPTVINIHAVDAPSFERFLRERGGGQAVANVMGELL